MISLFVDITYCNQSWPSYVNYSLLKSSSFKKKKNLGLKTPNYGKSMVEKLTCFKGIKKLKNENLIASKTLNYGKIM